MKSIPSYFDHFCYFGSRIRLHSYIRMTHTICQVKSGPGWGRSQRADPGYREEYRIKSEID